MIFFAPAYDPATRLNLAIVRALLRHGAITLFGADATRTALLSAMSERADAAVFAMSHGEKERLLAQNLTTDEELERAAVSAEERKKQLDAGKTTALEAGDVARVGERRLFVFACHTASQVGQDLTAQGAVYWGYSGAINAPAENPELAFLFIPIFEHIRGAWHRAETAQERLAVMEEIAAHCERAQTILDEMGTADVNLDTQSAYLCLLHIWDRLRIWVGPAESPEHHPRSSPPLFLM